MAGESYLCSSFDANIGKLEGAAFKKKPVDIFKLAEVDEDPDWEEWQDPRATNLQSALDRPPVPWRLRKAVLFARDLSVRRRRYPNKHYKADGLFVVDRAWALDSHSSLAILPLTNVICNTAVPRRLSLATNVRIALILSTIKSFDECLKPETISKLRHAERMVKSDIRQLLSPFPQSHRLRARKDKASTEIRILPSECCATVHEAIEQGFILRVENGRDAIFDHTKHSFSNFGFNVEIVIKHAARLNWLDLDLLDCLRKGFDYACDDTPPIPTFSPHYSQAMENAKEFFLQVNQEIQRGWFSDPQKVPQFIPFRVLPGSIIEKIDEGFRLVWDASWPHPAWPFGSIQLENGRFMPTDANSFAHIPYDLQAEWPYIEAIGEILSTLQTAANLAKVKV